MTVCSASDTKCCFIIRIKRSKNLSFSTTLKIALLYSTRFALSPAEGLVRFAIRMVACLNVVLTHAIQLVLGCQVLGWHGGWIVVCFAKKSLELLRLLPLKSLVALGSAFHTSTQLPQIVCTKNECF